jgi:hypothetical protein
VAEVRPAAADIEKQGEEHEQALPPNHPPVGGATPPDKPEDEALPANHPPIGGAMPSKDDLVPRDEPAATIAWKAPTRWSSAPNASAMRLATYRIPPAVGVTGDAELTVVRAGGSVDANLDRWLAQFTDGSAPKRSSRTVNGLSASLLEVSGTFLDGGPAMNGARVTRPGYMLLGAVVETRDGTYFFKLVGPAASVRAARPDFDAFVSGITPAGASASH